MSRLAELPVHIRDSLKAEMNGEERVLLVTRPSWRHAWGNGEVSEAQSLLARAVVGALRVGLAGPLAIRLLAVWFATPVLILQDMGFTVASVGIILVAMVVLGVIAGMASFVAVAPLLWMWHSAHSVFVVSERAVYEIRDRGERTVTHRTALPSPEKISVCRLRESGIGDVLVGHGSVYLPPGEGTDGVTAEYDIGLLSVPDAERVAEVVRAAAGSIRTAP